MRALEQLFALFTSHALGSEPVPTLKCLISLMIKLLSLFCVQTHCVKRRLSVLLLPGGE